MEEWLSKNTDEMLRAMVEKGLIEEELAERVESNLDAGNVEDALELLVRTSKRNQ